MSAEAGLPADGRVFVDTNVLVYAYDASAPRKRDIARALILDRLGDGALCLSTQVLAEFYSVVTTKGETTLPGRVAQWFMEQLGAAHVAAPSHATLAAAARRSATGGLTIWDALIVEAALELGATTLFTEDAGLLEHVARAQGAAGGQGAADTQGGAGTQGADGAQDVAPQGTAGGRLVAVDPFAGA